MGKSEGVRLAWALICVAVPCVRRKPGSQHILWYKQAPQRAFVPSVREMASQIPEEFGLLSAFGCIKFPLE